MTERAKAGDSEHYWELRKSKSLFPTIRGGAYKLELKVNNQVVQSLRCAVIADRPDLNLVGRVDDICNSSSSLNQAEIKIGAHKITVAVRRFWPKTPIAMIMKQKLRLQKQSLCSDTASNFILENMQAGDIAWVNGQVSEWSRKHDDIFEEDKKKICAIAGECVKRVVSYVGILDNTGKFIMDVLKAVTELHKKK